MFLKLISVREDQFPIPESTVLTWEGWAWFPVGGRSWEPSERRERPSLSIPKITIRLKLFKSVVDPYLNRIIVPLACGSTWSTRGLAVWADTAADALLQAVNDAIKAVLDSRWLLYPLYHTCIVIIFLVLILPEAVMSTRTGSKT